MALFKRNKAGPLPPQVVVIWHDKQFTDFCISKFFVTKQLRPDHLSSASIRAWLEQEVKEVNITNVNLYGWYFAVSHSDPDHSLIVQAASLRLIKEHFNWRDDMTVIEVHSYEAVRAAAPRYDCEEWWKLGKWPSS